MSRRYPGVPKGKAVRLDLTLEYDDGYQAGLINITKNPYNFFNDYEMYYAWDIGNQVGIREYIK